MHRDRSNLSSEGEVNTLGSHLELPGEPAFFRSPNTSHEYSNTIGVVAIYTLIVTTPHITS